VLVRTSKNGRNRETVWRFATDGTRKGTSFFPRAASLQESRMQVEVAPGEGSTIDPFANIDKKGGLLHAVEVCFVLVVLFPLRLCVIIGILFSLVLMAMLTVGWRGQYDPENGTFVKYPVGQGTRSVIRFLTRQHFRLMLVMMGPSSLPSCHSVPLFLPALPTFFSSSPPPFLPVLPSCSCLFPSVLLVVLTACILQGSTT
jgi:hypothetical protein